MRPKGSKNKAKKAQAVSTEQNITQEAPEKAETNTNAIDANEVMK